MVRRVRLIAGAAAAAALLGCSPPGTPLPDPSAPGTTAAAPPVPRPSPSPAWPVAADCRTLAMAVASLPATDRARLAPAAAPLALATHTRLDTSGLTAATAADLPLPPDDGSRRCVIEVAPGPSERAAPRRPVAHEMVRSTYRAGGSGRANPEHRRLRRELRRLEARDELRFQPTGDAELDLIGLVAGSVLREIGAAVDGRAASAVRARLAATAPTLEEPVWEPYAFAVTTIEATRRGVVRARLLDRAAGTAWTLEEPVVERRLFRVASGRRSRDRGLLEGGGSDLAAMADVAVWEQAGLQPSLVGLAAALGRAEGPGAPAEAVALAPTAPSRRHVGSVEVAVGADGVRRFTLSAGPAPTDPDADP